MAWLLFIPAAISAAWLYWLFKPPARTGEAEMLGDMELLPAPVLDIDTPDAVMTVHAAPEPAGE